MPKPQFLEVKVRFPNADAKAAVEAAAEGATPVALSVNQWMIVAASEKLARDAQVASGAQKKRTRAA